MKKLVTLISLFTVLSVTTYSQEESVGLRWDKQLAVSGYHKVNDMAVDKQGNVYVAGYWTYDNSKPESHNMLIGKFNSQGALEWQDTINGVEGKADVAFDIAVDNNGDIYLAGASEEVSPLIGSVTLVKYNSTGTRLWQKKYTGPTSEYGTDYGFVRIGTDKANSLYVSTNRAFLTGVTIIAKFNSTGTMQWEKEVTGAFTTASFTDENGNTYITGTDATYFAKFLTAKIDSDGKVLWMDATNVTPEEAHYGYDITVDNDGNTYVLGRHQPSGGFPQVTVLKYSATGAFQWKKTKTAEIGVKGSNNSGLFKTDSEGNVYTVTNTVGSTWSDILLTKYNAIGDEVWAKTYNGTQDRNDLGFSLTIDGKNNIYITGQAISTNEYGYDLVTMKYDPQGRLLWAENYFDDAVGQHIAVMPSGDVYVSGHRRVTSNASGSIYVLKYSPALASIEKEISGSGTYDFNTADSKTAITITINSFTGAGTLNVSYFGFPAVNLEFDALAPVNVSQYKWVIDALGLKDVVGELMIAMDQLALASVLDPSDIKVYKREIEGAGPFKEIITSVQGNNLVAQINSFSEFILGSTSTPLLVEEEDGAIPQTAMLSESFPMPFKNSTKIRFALSQQSHAALTVHDSFGKEIAVLVNEQLEAGNYYYQFNGENLPSGIYFYKLTTDHFTETKKMMLAK